ncbi:MAG TPA: Uma2 family endonuclease [Gammaproteobacteria bacterium]
MRVSGDYYKSAHPGPADVLLIVEVAEASLSYDREVKVPLYARHGIAETWIVDLEGRRVVRPTSAMRATAPQPARALRQKRTR